MQCRSVATWRRVHIVVLAPSHSFSPSHSLRVFLTFAFSSLEPAADLASQQSIFSHHSRSWFAVHCTNLLTTHLFGLVQTKIAWIILLWNLSGSIALLSKKNHSQSQWGFTANSSKFQNSSYIPIPPLKQTLAQSAMFGKGTCYPQG